MKRASRTRLLAALFLVLGVMVPVLALAQSAEAEDVIVKDLKGLRGLSDEDRVGATRSLAERIRSMPVGLRRLQFALSLSHVSTEGDFGRDTLQAVTDTLSAAVREFEDSPADIRKSAYEQLASMVRYEGMSVKSDAPEYVAATQELLEIEAKQAKVDFELKDLTGDVWKLSDLKGKVVLVNFWATWCPPCRKEMPDLQDLYMKFKDQGFIILAISDEELDKVKPYIDEHKYTYPVMLDPGRKVNERYMVHSIPKNFLYDREGKLVAQTMDMRTRKQFLELLARVGLKED